jgi:hypothetical protein
MIQGRRGPSFAAKALQRSRIMSNAIGKKFEGYKPAEADILSLVHHTHPPTAQLLDNAVVRDGLADHWRESYVWKTFKSMKAMGLAWLKRIVVGRGRDEHR